METNDTNIATQSKPQSDWELALARRIEDAIAALPPTTPEEQAAALQRQADDMLAKLQAAMAANDKPSPDLDIPPPETDPRF